MAAQSPIVSFNFVAQSVRVVMRGDEPWFVAADVCAVLDIAETHRALARLDDDEKGRHTMTTPGGNQDLSIINESGLYALILTSRKPEAKKFKKWVTSEVLPALRRTGRYEMPQAPAPTLSQNQQTYLQNIAWSVASAFYMEHATKLWLLKYCRVYVGVTRFDQIPSARCEDVANYLTSLRRPVDDYLRHRVRHERDWLTQTLKRELDRRLGRANDDACLIKVCAKHEISLATLYRWMATVKNIPRSEWPAVLRPIYKGRQFTDIPSEAWTYFLECYRRSESLRLAYQAYAERARAEGWDPLSEATVRRKLIREGLLLPRRRRFEGFDI
ncbi:MAG: BRO family protein [Candidatus Contendobacter sp.]|nr:BRO family protein [Candidatus Contendobacter sp.]MDG4556067.1 BRO family protein [Candidatus Contendobacter sp.]